MAAGSASHRRLPWWLLPVVVGQALYSLGTSISTGTVFRYTVDDWQLPALAFTVLLILPETAQSLAVLCGGIVRDATSAKRLWFWTALVARFLATGAACLPLLDPSFGDKRTAAGMILLLGLLEAVQAVSYVALVVWLTRLVKGRRFGSVFGPRRAGVVAGLIAVPILLIQLGPEIGGTFDLLVGNLVAATGLAIIAVVPADIAHPGSSAFDAQATDGVVRETLRSRLAVAVRRPGVKRLICSTWHLAAAQGLTQYVFFRYLVDVLEVSAAEKSRLIAIMFALQLPLAWVAGWLCDRFDDRRVYAVGVWVTATALPCWLLARPGSVWLTTAYVLWGGFSLVNVAIQTMSLRWSDETTRPEVVSLVRFGGGLLAALTPLAVSPLLPDRVSAGMWEEPLSVWGMLMGISFLGRLTAPLWLFRPDESTLSVSPRVGN